MLPTCGHGKTGEGRCRESARIVGGAARKHIDACLDHAVELPSERGANQPQSPRVPNVASQCGFTKQGAGGEALHGAVAGGFRSQVVTTDAVNQLEGLTGCRMKPGSPGVAGRSLLEGWG